MKSLHLILATLLAGSVSSLHAQTDPPFSGTIFIDPDIIVPSDPTTFQQATYLGQGTRTMFDRRVNDWINVNAYLVEATFDDGLTIEIQVNPEFGSPDSALAQAQRYSPVIGRLPTALRKDVQTVWIHRGVQPFGGGNNNLLIHIGQADLYIADGILEETLVHEAAHTSLDGAHASAGGWLAAQTADPTFISTYARDFPNREDIAESFLPYLAIRHRADRISDRLESTVTQTIPNRIAYFDGLGLDMYPIVAKPVSNEPEPGISRSFALLESYPNPFSTTTTLRYHVSEAADVNLVVLDVHGRVVETLVSGHQSLGYHQSTWDATGAPSGLYLVKLEAGGVQETRSIALVR